MIQDMTLLCLVGLNIFQMMFWSYQTHKLINKVMSFDYHSYKKAAVVVAPDKPLPKVMAPQSQVMVDFQPV